MTISGAADPAPLSQEDNMHNMDRDNLLWALVGIGILVLVLIVQG